MGDRQLSRESTTFATWGSRVRIPSAPPFPTQSVASTYAGNQTTRRSYSEAASRGDSATCDEFEILRLAAHCPCLHRHSTGSHVQQSVEASTGFMEAETASERTSRVFQVRSSLAAIAEYGPFQNSGGGGTAAGTGCVPRNSNVISIALRSAPLRSDRLSRAAQDLEGPALASSVAVGASSARAASRRCGRRRDRAVATEGVFQRMRGCRRSCLRIFARSPGRTARDLRSVHGEMLLHQEASPISKPSFMTTYLQNMSVGRELSSFTVTRLYPASGTS